MWPCSVSCRTALVLTFAVMTSMAAGCAVGPQKRGTAFESILPSEAGYSEEKLKALEMLLQASGSESLLLLHEGKVFFSWGDVSRKRLVHSMRKALLNGLIGQCVAKGKLDLDATLAQMQVDDIMPSLSAAEKEATLLQVLQSRSGVYHEAAAESEGMAAQRPARGSHAPGNHYYYNNWDFNVAGFLFEKHCGTDIYSAFDERIARPLGMQDWRKNITNAPANGALPGADVDCFYQLEATRSRYPAYHFRLSARDLARYGQLFLNRGRWGGRPIVPEAWIAESTRPVSIIDARYGLAYGLLWDVLVPDSPQEQASFFHTGAGVHMLGVYPKHKLVMVHRVNTEDGAPFDDGKLYAIIRAIHAARLKPGR